MTVVKNINLIFDKFTVKTAFSACLRSTSSIESRTFQTSQLETVLWLWHSWHLAERSLPSSEIRGSNPNISKVFRMHLFVKCNSEKTKKNRKRGRDWPVFGRKKLQTSHCAMGLSVWIVKISKHPGSLNVLRQRRKNSNFTKLINPYPGTLRNKPTLFSASELTKLSNPRFSKAYLNSQLQIR